MNPEQMQRHIAALENLDKIKKLAAQPRRKRRLVGNRELLDRSQADRALRDLMPVVDALTNADALASDTGIFVATAPGVLLELHRALIAFRATPQNSPAVKAYLRWLEENTTND